MKFEMTEVSERPYLYVERTTGMDPDEIGAAMGAAFGEVAGFLQEHGIMATSAPLSAYYEYDPEKLTFRAGFPVAPADLERASGNVEAGTLPGGRVMTFTHVGPYSRLRDSYAALMAHMAENGLEFGGPAWEVYVDDPAKVPEEDLHTLVYVSIAEPE
ncbi:GyrI-like domain-containing protein [Rhodobium gokarnense]|uniref:Effector-binding domain-containing protein n=1 Tax=Rhodobium gokarnense TaxID=364296 RepID=A0ABT3H7C1_9HYPH|nr:GyrI-like domain-containing protein [Rhodobium gokarnense]MCW2306275.1 effector-binding domain-containing protein [Rhodobium gokarnense]